MEVNIMSNVIQKFLDEGIGTSTIRRNKQTKRNTYAGTATMTLARSKKDPMLIKYQRYNKMRLEMKRKLKKKYGSKAKSMARKNMR